MSEETKKQEILYQVKAVRDSKMLKAFITFVYRVNYPRVSSNFIVYGIIVFVLPFLMTGSHPILAGICFGIGLFMILMGLFRHYIPLTRMKKIDKDYIEQVVTTYNFGKQDLKVYRGDELLLIAGSYHKITGFYHDEFYYYLSMNEDDLFVLPKDCFTIGDAVEFKQFIVDKSQMECRWIPATFKNKFLVKKAVIMNKLQTSMIKK